MQPPGDLLAHQGELLVASFYDVLDYQVERYSHELVLFPTRIDNAWLPAHLRLQLAPATFWKAETSPWVWNVYLATGTGAASAAAPTPTAAQATIRAVSLVRMRA